VAVILNPTGTTAKSLRETQAAAQSFGVLLQTIEVRDPKEFDNAFSAIVRGHAYAVLVLADPMLTDHRRWIAELATQSRLPIVHWNSDWPEAGGLMSYGPSNTGMHRRVATYVDKILKGAKPADLPVEQPIKFELVINLKTTKQIGLTIPPNVLPELIVIFVVALVVFGPSKLPELGKSLGEAIRGFKKSISESDKPSIKNSDSRKDDQGDSKP